MVIKRRWPVLLLLAVGALLLVGSATRIVVTRSGAARIAGTAQRVLQSVPKDGLKLVEPLTQDPTSMLPRNQISYQ
jgi:hypothetical protein